MDNHAHLLVRVKTSEHLGNFMRTVNSQLSRFINKTFGRDSQAIRERYKSPIVTNTRYLQKATQYIWLNRYRVSKSNPERDPFCSVSWRLHGELMINGLTNDNQKKSQFKNLLSPYKKLGVLFIEDERKYARDLLNAALSSVSNLFDKIFQSSHTIGDRPDVDFRLELMKAYRRNHLPWVSL